MEFKGTKQKWIISTNNEVGVLISTHPMSRDICTVWKYDNDFLENQESNANALLISKAPEMLEMLDRLVELNKSDNIEMPKFIKEEIEQLIKEATEI
jgi:hypothetical protein